MSRSFSSDVATTLVAALVLLVATESTGFAQVGPSARIGGLGPDFAGLVDDPITDASQNPARLASVEGRQVYIGRLPRSFSIVRIPELNWTFGRDLDLPVEGYNLDGYYFLRKPFLNLGTGSPVSLTYFSPFPGGAQSSMTLEVASNGRDDLDSRARVFESRFYDEDDVVLNEIDDASRDETARYTLDAALSTSRDPGAAAYGVRLTAFYTTYTSHRFRENRDLWAPPDNILQQSMEYDLGRSTDDYDDIGAALTVGRFRPGGAFREASISGGYRRVKSDITSFDQYVYDEDADGDGFDESGFNPDYTFRVVEAIRERDFSGPDVSARLVFDRDEKFRAVVSASGLFLTGDGDATFSGMQYVRDISTDLEESQDIAYTYDNGLSSVDGSLTAAYVDEFHEGIIVAMGARVTYEWDRVDEEMSGDAGIRSHEGTQNLVFETGYSQDIYIEAERLTARVSLGAEWALEKYLTFRAGVYHEAYTEEVRRGSNQTIEADTPFSALFRGGSNGGSDVQYQTITGTSAGLSVHLDDRLFAGFYTGSFSFTGFSYGTLRYVF